MRLKSRGDIVKPMDDGKTIRRDAPILNTPEPREAGLIPPAFNLAGETPLPEAAALVFFDRLFQGAMTRHSGRPLKAPGFRLGALRRKETDVLLARCPMGAPAAVLCLEALLAGGVRRAAIAGAAGALDPKMQVGGLYLPRRALREEGASYHYLPASRFVAPDAGLTSRIENVLRRRNAPFESGACWTTDAPHRETRSKAEAFAREGIGCVDMEAAALFAVGAFRGAAVAGLFYISDLVHQTPWRPGFQKKAARSAENLALDCVLEALADG